jgi:transcriptional regulator with PAS, ATPase and Fis domain
MMAQTDAAIMIYGESGTGKELVARAIHQLSKRNTKPFITVNCGALPDNLLESELFGYKKGAFTDAYQDTPGLVESAAGGTLFLDEIGEISSVVQVKLLRFLQSKEYKQLGSPKPQKANVRIICATNRNLKKMVDARTFREDLFYRLNIVPITVPSLRERKTDIPVLANHFLNQFCDEYSKDIKGFSTRVIQNLVSHNWPGNVRELENKVQQMVVLCEGSEVLHMDWTSQIGFDNIDTNYELENFKAEKKRVVDDFERHYIENMLEQTNGNLSEAAKRAGMDRKNFWQKAQKHKLRSKETTANL